MSSNKSLKNISQLNHQFNIGQEVYFSCLIPHFDWFDKKFTIKELLEPIKLKITKHHLMPEPIIKTDNILLKKLRISNIVRKYVFSISLEYDNNIKLIVFEDRNKQITVLHESNKIVSYDLSETEQEFMKLVISTKRDLEFDKEETIIVRDENFNRFLELYNEALELYPEEIIKLHDSTNLL